MLSKGSGSTKLYINKVLVSTHSGSITSFTGSHTIVLAGNATDLSGYAPNVGPNATYSNLAMYTAALSQQDVTALYDATPGLNVPPPPTYTQYETLVRSLNPYIFYPMDETSGTVVYDKSGLGNAGVYTTEPLHGLGSFDIKYQKLTSLIAAKSNSNVPASVFDADYSVELTIHDIDIMSGTRRHAKNY